MGERGAAKGDAQLEREVADIVGEIGRAACEDTGGAHEIAIIDLDPLE